MNKRILSCLMLLYFMTQAISVLANTDVQTSMTDCQLKGKQCVNFGAQSNLNDKSKDAQSAAIEAEGTCRTQAGKVKEDIQWDKFTKGIANGESISSLLYALDSSTLSPVTSGNIDTNDVDYDVISEADVKNCKVNEVPLPSAGWLFVSSIIGFATFSNRRRV